MSGLNKTDLSNMSVPSENVAIVFLEKIGEAVKWFVSPRDIKLFSNEAHKSIIDEISKKEDINPIERAVIISNYKKIIREYKNQCDIVNLALEHLAPDFNKDAVSDEWITFFSIKLKT